MKRNILVTGGAGYVGSIAVPKLLAAGHNVKVLDLYLYGQNVLDQVKDAPGLIQVKGDIRDEALVAHEIQGADTVLHLACISNDPSYELDPELGKSINYGAFLTLVKAASNAGIKRFIYASSSSVYGVKNEPEVTEELPLEPLTDYSKYKALCEEVLLREAPGRFTATVVRPSTVCGYSPRLRLDLTVNILTNHAVNKGAITVFGGDQKRPNIHIEDMADLYVLLMDLPDEKIRQKVWNAGFQNYTVSQIASMVKEVLGKDLPITKVPSNDPRSYHVSSKKIAADIGFVARRTVQDAISDLVAAFEAGLVPNPLDGIRYYNIKTMQAAGLK